MLRRRGLTPFALYRHRRPDPGWKNNLADLLADRLHGTRIRDEEENLP